MATKTKRIDCVQIKRAAQQQIRERVRGMTPEQEIAFFQEGADEFEKRIEAAKAAAKTTAPAAPPAPSR